MKKSKPKIVEFHLILDIMDNMKLAASWNKTNNIKYTIISKLMRALLNSMSMSNYENPNKIQTHER